MTSFGIRIQHYLDCHHRGEEGNAYHGLIEMDGAALPELVAAYRATSDPRLRVLLLKVLWEGRQPSVIPLLEEALGDAEPTVWKTALDGLVTLASPASIAAMRLAGERRLSATGDPDNFGHWLQEAIAQAEDAASKDR